MQKKKRNLRLELELELREDREHRRESIPDGLRFDSMVCWIHAGVEHTTDMELEELISTLRDEKQTFQDNVWSEGPYHMILGGHLKLMNVSWEEWAVIISRVDPDASTRSLTSEQFKLMKRFEDLLADILEKPKKLVRGSSPEPKLLDQADQSNC